MEIYLPPAAAELRPAHTGLRRTAATHLAAVLGLGAAAALGLFVFESVPVRTASMAPAILAGDHLLVNKRAYACGPAGCSRGPERGALVVLSDGTVRRVAAVAGDRVELRADGLFINGARTAEPLGDAVNADFAAADKAWLLQPREFFVLADAPLSGNDSRELGPIKSEQIIGKPVFIYWSWRRSAGSLRPAFARIGRLQTS